MLVAGGVSVTSQARGPLEMSFLSTPRVLPLTSCQAIWLYVSSAQLHPAYRFSRQQSPLSWRSRGGGSCRRRIWNVTWTKATPVMRISRESHWYTPSFLLSIDTENSAVVRIFSWYVTCGEGSDVGQAEGRWLKGRREERALGTW